MTQERHSELMAVFQARKTGVRRKGGGRINAALIQDIQIAAFLMDPAQAPSNDRMYEVGFHKFIEAYLSGSGSTEDQENCRTRIFLQCKAVRNQWRCERADPDLESFLKVLYKNPVLWWDHLQGENRFTDVYEFSIRVLAASPSSCAVERSFSLQKRIRTDARNRMTTEKYENLFIVTGTGDWQNLLTYMGTKHKCMIGNIPDIFQTRRLQNLIEKYRKQL